MPVDDPEVLDPPVTVSPTPTFTAATVPAIDAVSVAWPSASCAAVTLLWAEVTWALAEAIWPAFAAAVAAVSCAWAAVSCCCARVTAACRLVGSMAASIWPAVTVSPTLTPTEVTLPLCANVRLAWLAGSIVPVAETVSLTVSVVAATSWVVVADSAAAAGRCR